MKKLAAVLFLSIFICVSTVSYAEETKETSGGAMMFDVIIARPLGLAAIAVGTAVFVIGLPFTLPTGSVVESAKKLIGEPILFTFRRPVGDISEGAYEGAYMGR